MTSTLRVDRDTWRRVAEKLQEEKETLEADNAELLDAMHRIAQWADAYPLEIFPMPDFARANEVLAAAGISMTAMSAANMRHVVEGVGKIAKAALLAGKDQPKDKP